LIRFLARALRLLLFWWLPALVLVIALLSGVVFWLAASERGSRVLLTTVANQFDGVVENVNGSLLDGLRIKRLDIAWLGVAVQAVDIELVIQWHALSQGLVHVNRLAVGDFTVVLTTVGSAAVNTPAESSSISLPVEIAIDDLAIEAFALIQDGTSPPVTLGGLQGTVAAGQSGAQVRINALRVAHTAAEMDIEGEFHLIKWADPWPITANVYATARGQSVTWPVCLQRLWGQSAAAAAAGTPAPKNCMVVMHAQAEGSLEGMAVLIQGEGGGAGLDVKAELTPRGLFPLRSAQARLVLPDGLEVDADVDWQSTKRDASVEDVLHGKLVVSRLDVGRLVGDAMPSALINLTADFDATLINQHMLARAGLDITVGAGSRWNDQPLAGHVRGLILGNDQAADMADPLAALRLEKLDVDLRVARDRLRLMGSLGRTASVIDLNLNVQRLAALWPGVPGSASLKGKLGGTIAAHRGNLQASYTPDSPRAGQLGYAPAHASLQFEGGWGSDPAARLDVSLLAPINRAIGWRGTINRLQARHAGFSVDLAQPLKLSFLPRAVAPDWQWQVAASTVRLGLPNNQHMALAHRGSRGAEGRWQTAGRIDHVAVNAPLIRGVLNALDPASLQKPENRSAPVNVSAPQLPRELALDLDWDLQFAGALSGHARIARRAGDLQIPGDPPVALGLNALTLDLAIKPTNTRASRVDGTLHARSTRMGWVDGTVQLALLTTDNGGLSLDPRHRVRTTLNAVVADLGWVSLLTGDAIEVGGAAQAEVEASGPVNGSWDLKGSVHATGLRLVQIDNGIRLFDGTLSATLADQVVTLDSLRFPATLRVLLTEWRTRTWITQEADAKDGYLEAKGQWRLDDLAGKVRIDVHRFPIVQRSDRFAMITGGIEIDAALPQVAITGDIRADAGWVSLEILQSVPSLDDDVRVRQPGDNDHPNVSLQATMNLKYDMGPRFYITGMGLNAGIIGNMQILLNQGRLSGAGQLRTRGGRIEAYGQGLQLRRGTVTFQGALDSPVLDIEALRTNQAVEAGVRVGGTAHRPRIDLVSYPAVSDVEKLSWLILGRGPDDSGGETALLLSAGAALLSGGEPFYRKFGLDDVTVRSGAIGSSGSILPDRTVASSINRPSEDLARQFVVASKRFANGITLSVEQSMGGAGTVGRASYLLRRGLSADIKGGTVNGLSLVYRTFFR
jgi:translocation and assembly module TamB